MSVFSGIATGGINLALGNIGMKLASRREAMAYMSSLNMVVAFFSAITPLIGGLLADFFSTQNLVWSFELKGADGIRTLEIVNLHGWSFLFIIGGFLALVSLKLLSAVHEKGEIQKEHVLQYMQIRLRKRLKKNSNTIIRSGIIKPIKRVQVMLATKVQK